MATLIGGCAYVDALDSRSSTLNDSITDYRNISTLLNIVRASRNEPMNFVALTGATGHATFNGSQGLPTYIIGPHTAATAANPVVARNYVFGPNSIQESAGTDFNVSLLDDPTSYSALMTPVDPSMIAFLQRQSLPLSVIFTLFVSEIRLIDNGKEYAFFTDQDEDEVLFFVCDPMQPGDFPHCKERPLERKNTPNFDELQQKCRDGQIACLTPGMIMVGYLMGRAVNFQAAVGYAPAPPGQQQVPSRICVDAIREGPLKTFGAFLKAMFPSAKPLNIADYADYFAPTLYTTVLAKNYRCDDRATPWIRSVTASQTGGASNAGSTNSISVCRDAACAASRTQTAAKTGNRGAGGNQSNASYDFYDGHSTIRLFMRSTWGMYQFLGKLIRREDSMGLYRVLKPGVQDDVFLFQVAKDQITDCFTSVTYSAARYCVPSTAYNSKAILSVLHQLANLYTKPNSAQQPNSGTVRVTQ
jgi:hypothetical protein